MPILDFHLDERSNFERVHRAGKGATLPRLQVRLLDGSTPVDLSTATVLFSMDDEDGVAKVAAAAGALVSPGTKGIVEYVWAAADVDTEGRFFGQFSVTIGGVVHLIPNNSSQRLRVEIGPSI